MKINIPIQQIGIYGKKPLLQILFNAHAYLKKHFLYTPESIQYPEEVQYVWDIWRQTLDEKGINLIGDCDDFMLQVVWILWRCGVPLRKISLSVGHAPTGEGHAIPLIMIDGILWQFDNMLKKPLPAWYGYHCVGYYVSRESGGIFNMEEKVWREFLVDNIAKPRELIKIDA